MPNGATFTLTAGGPPIAIPIGATLTFAPGPPDSHITLTVVTADGHLQTGNFFGQGTVKLFQSTSGAALTEVDLHGTTATTASVTRAHAARGSGRHFIWGHVSGNFRTTGQYGAATVRGTYWLTEDRPGGTFFRVINGVVTVHDFDRHHDVVLKAGQHYLARAACSPPTDFHVFVPVPAGTVIQSLTASQNHHALLVEKHHHLAGDVRLRNLGAGDVVVHYIVKLPTGSTQSITRHYPICSPKH